MDGGHGHPSRDFNNLLTGILGATEFARDATPIESRGGSLLIATERSAGADQKARIIVEGLLGAVRRALAKV